jgi:hypothetical protein
MAAENPCSSDESVIYMAAENPCSSDESVIYMAAENPCSSDESVIYMAAENPWSSDESVIYISEVFELQGNQSSAFDIINASIDIVASPMHLNVCKLV